jgi:predicted  nucleic acid-binding Zn-ribbon protein
MDVELTSLGVSRLAESTPEEREKATEAVLKNLEEHGGYYSAFIHYETEFRNSDNKPNFKTFLKEFYGSTKMKEVDVRANKGDVIDKDNKMEKLKEAIKTEVRNMLVEAKDDDDDKSEKKASKGAKGKDKKLKALDKEIEKLEKEREKNKEKLQPALNKYKDGKLTADEYREKSKELVDRNKEIVARVKEIEKEKEEISLKEKADRREVAKTMMERDTHMELLKIVKEAGVSLKEGSEGVKMYYEIAKVAYQEGFMAGLKK